MATYINRIIEVKVPEKCTGTVSYNNLEEDLKNITEYKNGMLYYITDIPWKEHDKIPNFKQWIANNPDDLSQGGNWVDVTNRKEVWELLPIWTSDMSDAYAIKYNTSTVTDPDGKVTKCSKYMGWSDNSWVMRDHYLSNWYSEYEEIKNKGVASDACEEVKNYINERNEYAYDKTYVLLSELSSIASQEFTKFKNTVKNLLISKKLESMDETLQSILNIVSNNPEHVKSSNKKEDNYDEDDYDDEELGDPIDNLFDEELGDYFNLTGLKAEITFIYGIVDMVYGYTNSENIRIHYWFD